MTPLRPGAIVQTEEGSLDVQNPTLTPATEPAQQLLPEPPGRGEHVVYRLVGRIPGIDPAEAVADIYVGLTSHFAPRMRAHAKRWWWPLVVPELCEFSIHPTRAEASAHERRMIGWYQPSINRAGIAVGAGL